MIPKLSLDSINTPNLTDSITTANENIQNDDSLQMFFVLFFTISLLILLILFSIRLRIIILRKKQQQQESLSSGPNSTGLGQDHLSTRAISSPPATLFHLLFELDRPNSEPRVLSHLPNNRYWEMLSRLREEWLFTAAVNQTNSNQAAVGGELELSSYLAWHRCHSSSTEPARHSAPPPTYAEVIREKQHEEAPPSYQQARRHLADKVDNNLNTT